MAGFGSNIKYALDSSKSLKDRAVNLRSCAMNLSHMVGVSRSEIIDQLKKETKVDLNAVASVEEIAIAAEWLQEYRKKID